jgi:RNA 3'-terminal phosphate cyclase (ATP)
LLTADRPSELVIEGGTHNPRAPTFEYLANAYLPLIERMGPRVAVELERPGFEPVGGGSVRARIEPARRLEPLQIETRGPLHRIHAEVLLSKLPAHIAEREASVLAGMLELDPSAVALRIVTDSPGPGNVVTAFAICERITEVFVGFGRRGVPAERVAQGVAQEVRRYLAAGVPVGMHLADQLLLPLSLAGRGSFVTLPPSAHTLTNIRVIQEFLPVEILCTAIPDSTSWRIEIAKRGGAD